MGIWFGRDNLEKTGLTTYEKRILVQFLQAKTWKQASSGEIYCQLEGYRATLNPVLGVLWALYIYSAPLETKVPVFLDLCILRYTSLGRRLSKIYNNNTPRFPRPPRPPLAFV